MVVVLLFFCHHLSANFRIDFNDTDLTITVTDGATGEELVGVSIFTDDQKFVGFTDIQGQVQLPVLSHREIVNFSYVGYDESLYKNLSWVEEVQSFVVLKLINYYW